MYQYYGFTPRLIIQHRLLSFRVPDHELCFLGVREIPLQTGSKRKVPHDFTMNFPPLFVSIMVAHWTFGHVLVLYLAVDVAIVDARVISFMRQIKGAHYFLALL